MNSILTQYYLQLIHYRENMNFMANWFIREVSFNSFVLLFYEKHCVLMPNTLVINTLCT